MSSASDRRKSGGGGDEGGGANWMDTYGDLVTLLLTFFVLLFSMSSVDAAKWEALVGSFTGVSAVGVDPISPEIVAANPVEIIGIPPQSSEAPDEGDVSEPPVSPGQTPYDPGDAEARANLGEMFDIINSYIYNNSIDAEVVMDEDALSLHVKFPDAVFFNTASATVLPEAYPVLDMVIEMFLEVEHLYATLRVEGHTDNRPINTPQYPSNWEVSADRALKVVSYFRQDGRLDSSRMSFAGFGEERPDVPNTSPENMAKNRRVEFVVEAAVLVRMPSS